MQESFDFAASGTIADLAFMRRALSRCFGPLEPFPRRLPIWQMVRSMLGAQTYDRVAETALKTLMWRRPEPAGVAETDPGALLRYIGDVTHAEPKSRHLVETMRRIGRDHPSYDLSFLHDRPLGEALAWLERLPGVGPKVAAATLNASTLAMPVFIVDSHVHRILLRFGLIGPRATAKDARDLVTAASSDASALLELFVRLKRLGQTVCRPYAAQCGGCPLASRCRKRTALGRPSAQEVPLRRAA